MKYQKFLSSLLFLICLALLFLFTCSDIKAQINHYSYFSYNEKINIPKDKLLSGKKLSVPSKIKQPTELHARAYCLMDGHSGRILFGKNENQKLPMASTTKIMTCIIALENAKPNQKVTASDYAASMPDVQLNMSPGDSFYLKDLLYSLMLESHNDTAVAIAESIGHSVSGFAKLMNEKASELGCTHTHFVTPNGLDDDNHYTTASDLCRIAIYAMKNPLFRKIIATPSHSFSTIDGRKSFSVNNHDAFLSSYPGALGIKTGFTGNAGYCFCGAAKHKKNYLVSAVLACGWPPHRSYKWADTKALMDYGFHGFKTVSLPVITEVISCHVTGGLTSKLLLHTENDTPISCMLSKKDNIHIITRVSKHLKAPIRSGDILGYKCYYINKLLLAKIPLIADNDIPAIQKKHLSELLFSTFLFQKSPSFF